MVAMWSTRVLALAACSAACLAPTTIRAQTAAAAADAAFGDASYVVQIHSTAENFVPPPSDTARTHVMTTESGQRFTCFLPPAPTPIAADQEDKEPSKQPGKQKDEVALVSFGRAASKKIRPKCLQYVDTEEHWVYELCPGILVRKVSLLEASGAYTETRAVDVDGEIMEKMEEEEPPSEELRRHDVVELGAFSTERSQPAVKFTEFEDAETRERVQHHKKPLFTQVFPTPDDEILVQFMCSAKAFDDTVAAVQWKPQTAQEQGQAKTPSAFLVVSRLYCDARFSDSEDHKLFTVASLLSPLRDLRTCIKRNEGWWTYEFCFGQGVRQYHRDSDGRVTVDFSLGHYDEDKNRALETSGAALVSEQIDATHDVSRPAYLEHYSHGTYCKEFDMQTPRTSRVFFYCSQGGANHHILAVKETQTCAYTIKISTPVLCDHPHFISDEQKSAAKTEIVHCVPLDEEAEAGDPAQA